MYGKCCFAEHPLQISSSTLEPWEEILSATHLTAKDTEGLSKTFSHEASVSQLAHSKSTWPCASSEE